MIHELRDGDGLLIGLDHQAFASEDDAAILSDELREYVKRVIGVRVEMGVISGAPNLFAVIRKEAS